MDAEPILFFVFGAIALAGGIGVITFKNPVYSALALIVAFFSQAGLFIVLGAHFVAAVQVIVYAGAIMVLFLFVIMLLNLGTIRVARPTSGAIRNFAIIAGIIFALQGAYIATTVSRDTAVAKATQQAAQTGATAITQAQQAKLTELENTYELSREQVNRTYVPKVAPAKTDVDLLTASEARQLIKLINQDKMGETYQIGSVLFSRFLLPFEVTSLILLVALVGVIALVKRERT